VQKRGGTRETRWYLLIHIFILLLTLLTLLTLTTLLSLLTLLALLNLLTLLTLLCVHKVVLDADSDPLAPVELEDEEACKVRTPS
jgi:hypothetical protein